MITLREAINQLDTFGIGMNETDEDFVARLLKGDFEKIIGISYDRFDEIHKYLIDNNPEKLI